MTTATATTPAYYRAGGTGVLRRFRGTMTPGDYWDDKIRCWIPHEWALCDWPAGFLMKTDEFGKVEVKA